MVIRIIYRNKEEISVNNARDLNYLNEDKKFLEIEFLPIHQFTYRKYIYLHNIMSCVNFIC